MTDIEKSQILAFLHQEQVNFATYNHIEMTDVGDGWAKARLALRPESLNVWHIPHGGVLFTLADMVTGTAAFSLRREPCLTVQSNMDFLSAAERDGVIYAEGKVLRSGRKLCFCEAELTDSHGTLLAKASAVLRFSGQPLDLTK